MDRVGSTTSHIQRQFGPDCGRTQYEPPKARSRSAKESSHRYRGDDTSAEALGRAGVARCRVVIAVSPLDTENAFVCLNFKKLAPNVPVIVTVSSQENKEKLDEVGADHIISPAFLSAKSILEALAHGPAAVP